MRHGLNGYPDPVISFRPTVQSQMKITTVSIMSAAVGLAALGGCSESPRATKSTARATIHLNRTTPAVLAHDGQEFSESEFRVFKATQELMLKSRLVLSMALRNRPGLMPIIKSHVRDGDAVQWLQGIIKVEFPGDAELMSVSCTLDDPKAAAAVLVAVVDSYKTEVADNEADQKRARFAEVDQAVVEHEQDIRNKRQELRNLASEVGSVDPEAVASGHKPFIPS